MRTASRRSDARPSSWPKSWAGSDGTCGMRTWSTRGGAAVLGRDDIGYLAPGMAADFIGYRLDTLPLAGGAVHDPLAALVFCQPPTVDLGVINGHVHVQDGRLVDVDLSALIAHH